MEVWWIGFLVDSKYLLIYVVFSFLLLLGYNRYAGMRRDATFNEIAIDSVEEMGLGLVIAALVTYLLGQITSDMPASEVVGKIVVEAMTVAIGVSVGTAQLGGGGKSDTGMDRATTSDPVSGSQQSPEHLEQPDLAGQLILAFCGAILFAANVAPTEEILMIGIESSHPKLLGLVGLSLLVSAVVLHYSGFIGAGQHVRRDGPFWIGYGIVTSYAAALLASALMLWFFRRFDGASLSVAISQIVVLAFPAVLGASAGRLLIQ